MVTLIKQPHARERRIVFKNIDRPGWTTDIDCYLNDGGYEELRKAIAWKPVDIVNEVKTSGLRGRGGAGFPCGVKWGFIKPGGPKPVPTSSATRTSREPGTFKDRYIIHQDPHQLVEGMIISCFAVGASLAYHLHPRRVPGRREAFWKRLWPRNRVSAASSARIS